VPVGEASVLQEACGLALPEVQTTNEA